MRTINKTIHYCWFGGNEIPERLQKCINSWSQKMPGWKLKRWDESNFDINSTKWTSSAYKKKKYAFVSDFVRLKALYEEGGLYLDTDVELLKTIEPLVERWQSFTGFENGNVLTSAVICASKKHPLIKLFLDYYQDKTFGYDVVNNNQANVLMMTEIAKQFGLKCDNTEQILTIPSINGSTDREEFHIFPRTYFCPLDFYHNRDFSSNTYAIHLFDASWLDDDVKRRILKERSGRYKIISNIKSFISRIIK